MPRDARRFLLAVVALVTGLALLRRRPVRGPAPEGNWRPADN